MPSLVVSKRARETYALLRTCLAWAPGPVYRRPPTLPGFQHGRRELTCEDCLANGKPMPGCETCGGSGIVSVDARDPMEAPALARGRDAWFYSDEKQRARDEQHRADQTLAKLASDERIRAGTESPLDPATYAVEQRDRLYRAGSYRELDGALVWLRAVYPDAYDVAMSVAYQPFGEEPVEPVQRLVVAVCEVLQLRMPRRIRVPSFVPVFTAEELEQRSREAKDALRWGRNQWASATRRDRKKTILALSAQGLPDGKIAARFGLDRRTVQEIRAGIERLCNGTASGTAA